MTRPLRVEFPGAIYHVTSRMHGNWKKESPLLVEDDRDRIRFLNRLGERVQEFDIRLYLFTLMANHFHLVLETSQDNLSRFMHALTTAYTVCNVIVDKLKISKVLSQGLTRMAVS